MKMKKMAIGIMVVALTLAWTGTSFAQGVKQAQRSAVSMEKTKAEVMSAYGQITSTIGALGTLMSAQVGDLRPLLKDYNSQIKRLSSDADRAKSRAKNMQTKNQQYFSSWSDEINEIADASIKANSLQRYKSTLASYKKVEQLLFTVGAAYRPLMSKLSDLDTAMNLDLTPSGLAALSGPYDNVRAQAVALQSAMRTAMAAMDATVGQLAPNAAAGM